MISSFEVSFLITCLLTLKKYIKIIDINIIKVYIFIFLNNYEKKDSKCLIILFNILLNDHYNNIKLKKVCLEIISELNYKENWIIELIKQENFYQIQKIKNKQQVIQIVIKIFKFFFLI